MGLWTVVFVLVMVSRIQFVCPEYFAETGDYLDGDIKGISPFLLKVNNKNGLLDERYRWPQAIIPYKFERNYRRSLASERPHAHVIGNGCYSFFGTMEGRQNISLPASSCAKLGIFVHELLHTVGLFHEQSRPDRDGFVKILWENIKEDHEHNFRKYSETFVSSYGVDYDYRSVLHYHSKAFSRNGKDTIVPKVPGAEIGQLEGMSDGDVLKVNHMYKCGSK